MYFYNVIQTKPQIEYEQIFGPAYKGIPLVSTACIGLASKFNKDVPWTFNR
jgi:orotate phosphoribosyltransferase